MSDSPTRPSRKCGSAAPDRWCIVYGGLVVGVSDKGLTLHMVPRIQLKLLSITQEDIPCIVQF